MSNSGNLIVATGATHVYAAIAGELRSRIISGQWQPGEKIASEKSLASEFRVCRATVKKSLGDLEREGLLWSRRGKGRFVSDRDTRGKTWVAGVVLFDQTHLAHPVMSKRLVGLQEVLGKAGYHLKAVAMNRMARPGAGGVRTSLAQLLRVESIDGAIVLAEQTDRSQVEQLAQYVPVVWLNHPTLSPRLLGIHEDHIGGAFAAAKHLLQLGHRHIALLTGPESFGIAHAQWDGARLAVREIASDGEGQLSVLYSRDAFTVEEGRELAQRLLDGPARPTAVICGSDDLAIGAFEVFRSAGLKVPDDISMVAWNDTLTAEQIPLSMTTVRIDFSRSAACGARMLLRLMEQADEPAEWEDEEIRAELIIRESTAPPKQADGVTSDLEEGGVYERNLER